MPLRKKKRVISRAVRIKGMLGLLKSPKVGAPQKAGIRKVLKRMGVKF